MNISNYFLDAAVNIEGNKKLRKPQIEAYIKIRNYFAENPTGEALVVLPTGTGKSGLISIAPFGVSKGRVLIITPGLVTKGSIKKTQEAIHDNFWINCDIVFNMANMPVVSEYCNDISDEHLISSNIVYSNIQKLTANFANGLIKRSVVGSDFFDMIIIDESHHAPANSWNEVLQYFNGAKKLHVTGTPFRGDGQELPGEKIHETPLSEVMRDRYVKLLRKETVNAHQLYFTMPEEPNKKLSKDEVLQLKEKEWFEKSIALSKECSLDVINLSLGKLEGLKELSPKVPHKILATACSIKHAEDLKQWYEEKGASTIIVHSDMEQKELESAFLAIDNHQCKVVVSVNMLMEGYDHKYLTILSLFRPYRSINAFAQVVGRVLRTIPDDEIVSFEIDNNAIVIYHQEIGLDSMWALFQKEIDRAKQTRIKDYTISDVEYTERDTRLGSVSVNDSFIASQESFLKDIDFNELFEKKRAELTSNINQYDDKLVGIPEHLRNAAKEAMKKAEYDEISKEIDEELIKLRPDIARKQMRETLVSKAENTVSDLLSDYNKDAKGNDLYNKFKYALPFIKENTTNDGILVTFINRKLSIKFGKVIDRTNEILIKSISEIDVIAEELRGMLNEHE